MFENAYKQQPTNEDLGAQTFFANVRTGNWKTAQQVRLLCVYCISAITDSKRCRKVATKMHKQFHNDRYLYWGVISTVLQVFLSIDKSKFCTTKFECK